MCQALLKALGDQEWVEWRRGRDRILPPPVAGVMSILSPSLLPLLLLPLLPSLKNLLFGDSGPARVNGTEALKVT